MQLHTHCCSCAATPTYAACLPARPAAGFAEQRKVPLRDLLLANQKLVAFLARQLPSKPELGAELAELMDCSLRTLTLAVLPQVGMGGRL